MERTVKIYRKVLFRYLVIMLAVVSLCVIMYTSMTVTTNKAFDAEQRLKAQNVYDSILSELEKIYDLMHEIVISDEISQAVYFKNEMYNYEYIAAIRKATEKLLSLKFIGGYVTDAYLVSGQTMVMFSTNGYYTDIDSEEYRQIVDTGRSGIFKYNNEIFLYQPNGYVSEDKLPDFVLLVKLNQHVFANRINDFAISNGGAARIYIDGKVTGDAGDIKSDKEIVIDKNKNLKLVWSDFDELYIKKSLMQNALFLILTFVLVIIMVLFMFYIFNTVNKPLSDLVIAFNKIEDGSFGYTIERRGYDEFRQIYSSFNNMSKKLEDSLNKTIQQRIMLEEAKFNELQSQINPHFLYNTLFLLKYLLRQEDTTAAEHVSEHLGNYFKYTCSTPAENITLKEEFSHIDNYIQIQKMRFGDSFEIEMQEVSGETAKAQIPKLTIQPLVENAFKYVVDRKSNSYLKINARLENQMLCVEISDNGDISDEQIEKMNMLVKGEIPCDRVSAIININRRLMLKFGSGSGLEFKRSSLGGLLARLCIEYEKKEVL